MKAFPLLICMLLCVAMCTADHVVIIIIKGKDEQARRRRSLSDSEQPQVTPLPCRFDVYDENNDGEVTEVEFEKALSIRSYYDQNSGLFSFLDENGKGTIEKSEFESRAPLLAKESSLLFPDCAAA